LGSGMTLVGPSLGARTEMFENQIVGDGKVEEQPRVPLDYVGLEEPDSDRTLARVLGAEEEVY